LFDESFLLSGGGFSLLFIFLLLHVYFCIFIAQGTSSMSDKAKFFEQKMKEATEIQTNAKESKVNRKWTPQHDNTAVGAHSPGGYKQQTHGPAAKRSLADLP